MPLHGSAIAFFVYEAKEGDCPFMQGPRMNEIQNRAHMTSIQHERVNGKAVVYDTEMWGYLLLWQNLEKADCDRGPRTAGCVQYHERGQISKCFHLQVPTIELKMAEGKKGRKNSIGFKHSQIISK